MRRKENKLPILDVLLIRNGNFIETEVYGKPSNNDIYNDFIYK